ncbi:hypothetical protein RISK_006481 [Rhodopirellula islandica]|uniref:Uncharacterized protein n=1 Tax=Rhodopirellula islandica TaxID=595434 RepID=A0A0J1B343_RHOIS|nr:hypothetical protein RISK_006481 [Rhodopirellula islandica]
MIDSTTTGASQWEHPFFVRRNDSAFPWAAKSFGLTLLWTAQVLSHDFAPTGGGPSGF